MPVRTRVLLVDDHPLFRLGITTLLEQAPEFEVVAHAASASEALEVYDRVPVDLVVIDVMLGEGCGIKLVRELMSRRPTRILGLSVLDEPVRVTEMLRAGALGFANKTQPFEEILSAFRSTVAGTSYVAPSIRDHVEGITSRRERLPLERLTQREREIFVLLAKGQSNEEIATTLAIRPRTVETHRFRLMKKLGTHSLAELVLLASRWGLSA